MTKVLDWLVKAPFYRLLMGAVILFLVIALAEGTLYWIGGAATVLYVFLLVYARLIKKIL